MKAIVTLITGRRYQAFFKRYCYSGWSHYAQRHGLRLLIFEAPFDLSQRAKTRSVAWQKCLAVVSDQAKNFEQIAWLDSDILVNSNSAPNIFEGVPADRMAAVRDFEFPSYEVYRSRLSYLENSWRSSGANVVSALSPQEYYEAFPLPPLNEVAQTGVFVLNPEAHESIFRRTYEQYEDRGDASFHYEMRPLSYEMVKSKKMLWLDPRFNAIPAFYLANGSMRDFVRQYNGFERFVRKMEMPVWLPLSLRQQRLRQEYRRLLHDNFFLHLAGRQFELPLISHW